MRLPRLRSTPSAALLFVIGAAALFASVLILDHPLWCGLISAWLGEEVFKIALQFLLITVMGGGVFAYFAARREEQAKAEARVAELQILDHDLGVAYRAVKRVKRSMRAKLRRDPAASARIDAQDFEAAMEEILDAQIATEQVREDISVRHDLLEDAMVLNLASALRYAARFLHDVYEDYERGRVQLRGDEVVIDASTPNLRNFLLGEPLPKDLTALLDSAREPNADLSARFRALDTFAAARNVEGGDERRLSAVAMECFRLASAQIRAVHSDALKASPYRISG